MVHILPMPQTGAFRSRNAKGCQLSPTGKRSTLHRPPQGESLCFPKQGNGWYFSPKRENPKMFFADRTAIRRAKPDPRLCDRVCLVQTFSLPLACTTTVLLQSLQCLAVTIHLTQGLCRFCKPPLGRILLVAWGRQLATNPFRARHCTYSKLAYGLVLSNKSLSCTQKRNRAAAVGVS